MNHYCKTFILTLCIIGLSSCSWLPKQKDITKDWSAQRLYTAAKTKLAAKDYEKSIKYYQLLETRYPFGKFAQQGQLEIAFAHYKNESFDLALAASTRFIRLNPQNPNVDYAYYLKGLINYRQKNSILEKVFPVDPSTRDPGVARKSFFDFKKLVTKFPNSKYAKDARQRMLYLRNNLAKHEIVVAKYYIQRGAHIAAVNRAKYVLEHYDGSPSVRGALEIMITSYDKLGLEKLRQSSLRVLKHNFPNHPWISNNKKRKRRWFGRKKKS
ncbi:Outer membrane beta-barrel assembly protein BamD [hydrothermal vent metagenome]|uniref:Outer membrane beta-barrel assembly protein BamD n=1 Tax=hydrothermal vent metagenome TaxID=652676 RepID=A0A3B0XVA9_9ZZZZ